MALTPLIPGLRLKGRIGVFAPAPVPFKTPDDLPFVSRVPANPLRPILFGLAFATSGAKQMGRPSPPREFGRLPLPATRLLIAGVTKDSTGAVLAGCSVALYRTSDDALIQRATSDENGNYSFSAAGAAVDHYVVAYKAGSPDVAGTTVNTLVGM